MNKERSVTYGAVVAAFLASLCCTGPLLFAALVRQAKLGASCKVKVLAE